MGPWVYPVGVKAARSEVEIASSDSMGVILLGIPLAEVTGESSLRLARSEADGSHLSVPAQERIRSVLLLGDIQRFETLTLHELVG